MITATVVRDPQPPFIYCVLGVMMLTAVVKGTRIRESSQRRTGWLEDAWTGEGALWILLFALFHFVLMDYFMWDGTIPFSPRDHLEAPWLGAFYLGVFLASMLCASFSRALGVWIGLTLKHRLR